MLENDDVSSRVVRDGEQPPDGACIRLCDDHAREQERLCARYNRLDEAAVLRTHHAVTSFATRTLGTDAVVAVGCPVCALQQFDYLGQIIPIVLGKRDS